MQTESRVTEAPALQTPAEVAASPARSSRSRLGLATWFLPSLADIVFLALLGFILGLKGRQLFNTDGDLARHLAVGRQILADGSIPSTDLFSHTMAGEPFVPYEWASEVLFALAHQQLGDAGVAVLAATLAAVPFLLLTRWMVRDGVNVPLALLLVVVGGLAASLHWLARPHLFTILLLLLCTRSLTLYQRTGRLRYLAILPPMMALWVNLHGGFLVGFVMLGVQLFSAGVREIVTRAERRTLPLALAGATSLAAVGLNPAGFSVLGHVMSYFHYRFLVDVTVEYRSPNFHELGPQLFAGLLLLGVASLALLDRRPGLSETITFGLWGFFALYSARNIPLFVATSLPILGHWATEALHSSRATTGPGKRRGIADQLARTERQMGRPLLPALGVAAALLVASGAVSGLQPRLGFDPNSFPVEALARAEESGARGRVFNYFPWGGYILYAGYPKHRVFIDGQTDFYGEELTREYVRVANLQPGWEEVLDRYQVEWVLFPHESPLSLLLARSRGWRLAYQDSTADIFVREEAP